MNGFVNYRVMKAVINSWKCIHSNCSIHNPLFVSGIPEGPFRPHEAAFEEGGRGRRGTVSQESTIGGRRDSGCRAGGQPTGTKGMISWFTGFMLWP